MSGDYIEACRLKQFIEEQQLTVTEYWHLPSATEEWFTELLANNRQLIMDSFAEAEVWWLAMDSNTG